MVDNYESYLKNLPVIPEVATRIMRITEDKLDISFKELEDIIKVDPGLTVKILRIANSALYARQREIKSLQMAITLLGFKNIKSLVMLVTASNVFTRYKKTAFYQSFWKHSILSAFLAKHIALRCNKKEQSEEVFLGALLHCIGRVAFFNSDQEKYQSVAAEAESSGVELEKLEKEAYGMDHKELGGSILKGWNFPDLYVDIARENETENITSVHKALVIIVSAATLIVDVHILKNYRPARKELLGSLFKHTALKESDLDYYKHDVMGDLKKDPMFQECQALFGITG
ncbi:MAG: HDOD domain-containing protein [Spirochaeta sp.]|nr:HDOD domain-containing protein [Spirochaeta sp.]